MLIRRMDTGRPILVLGLTLTAITTTEKSNSLSQLVLFRRQAQYSLAALAFVLLVGFAEEEHYNGFELNHGGDNKSHS